MILRVIAILGSWRGLWISPFRIALWLCALPLVICGGAYVRDACADAFFIDHGYSSRGFAACSPRRDTPIWGIPGMTPGDTVGTVASRVVRTGWCPAVGTHGEVEDTAVFVAYLGEFQARSLIQPGYPVYGYLFGGAIIGLIGRVVDGLPEVRVFCTSTDVGTDGDRGYSGLREDGGTGYTEDPSGTRKGVWGHGVGDPVPLRVLLGDYPQDSQPRGTPNGLILRLRDEPLAESLVDSVIASVSPQWGTCSIQALEGELGGGETGYSTGSSAQYKHVLHELGRLRLWAGEHGGW